MLKDIMIMMCLLYMSDNDFDYDDSSIENAYVKEEPYLKKKPILILCGETSIETNFQTQICLLKKKNIANMIVLA